MFRNLPVRQKLMWIILVTSVVVMLLMRGAFFVFEMIVFRNATERQLATLGEVIAANSTAALAFENPEDAREILSALRAERNIVAAALYDRNGRLFSLYPEDLEPGAVPAEPGVSGYSFEGASLTGFQPVQQKDLRLGTLYLKFDATTLMRDWIVGSVQIALAVMTLVLLVAYVLSRSLQKQISEPIVNLAETARAISERRDYTVRAVKLADDELGLLTDAFNQLLVQIDAQTAALDEHAIVAITDPQGRITYVNDKFCAISKYSREELIGQDHRIINSGHHPKEFIRDLWTTIARGGVWKGEIRNRAKDGSIYWVDTTIVPFLKADGKPYQYVAIRADVTERKRVEGELHRLNESLEHRVAERTRQLEIANKELESFSYSVSHDLRAPLRHIDGFAGLLVKADGEKLSDRGRTQLTHIADSAKQMGMLIDDLLVFSRMGRTEMHHAQVDLGRLVDETIESMRNDTRSRNIQWVKGSMPVVPGDRSMLRQVFVNLLSNAVKYTRPRDPARIEIGCDQGAGDEWIVFVKDNGVGFEMEYVDKLFGVFQRLHLAEDFEGTGIGLANVRRIVTRHGGRTWAEGVPDAGASFYFTLPKQGKDQT